MSYMDWIARVDELPDRELSWRELMNLKWIPRTIRKAVKVHGLLEKTVRNTYRKSEKFYRLKNDRAEDALQQVWKKELDVFYDLVGSCDYLHAYEKLGWIIKNRRNDSYDNQIKMYCFLLEELLEIKESSFSEFSFDAKSISDISKKERYYELYAEFQKNVFEKSWGRALKAIIYFKVFMNEQNDIDSSLGITTICNLTREIIKKFYKRKNGIVQRALEELYIYSLEYGKDVFSFGELIECGLSKKFISGCSSLEKVGFGKYKIQGLNFDELFLKGYDDVLDTTKEYFNRRKYCESFKLLEYYVLNGDFKQCMSNILDCLDSFPKTMPKNVNSLISLGNFRGLSALFKKVNDGENLPYRFVSIEDNENCIANFKMLIDKMYYIKAYDYVGKCLCGRSDDEMLKLYSKVFISLISKFIKNTKVVLDNDKVDELVCNREYDKLMEIFRIVGKDNLALEYIPIYNIVESMVNLINGQKDYVSEEVNNSVFDINVVSFFGLLEQKRYFEAYDCLRKIPVEDIYFWETYNYLLMDILKLQLDVRRCSKENVPKFKKCNFSKEALDKCEELINTKEKVINRQCYKLRVGKK